MIAEFFSYAFEMFKAHPVLITSAFLGYWWLDSNYPVITWILTILFFVIC